MDLFQANNTSDRDLRFAQEFKAGVAKVDVLIGGTGGVKATRATWAFSRRSSR